jgi:hypothetical protein
MQKLRSTHEIARSNLTPVTFDGADHCAAIEADVVAQALAKASAAMAAPSRAANRTFKRSHQRNPPDATVRSGGSLYGVYIV